MSNYETDSPPVTAGNYAHIIRRQDAMPVNTRDVLVVKFVDAADGVTYEVTNYSKKDRVVSYLVRLFISRDGSALLASCNCVSWKLCKHIAEAWRIHCDAEVAGFVKPLRTGEMR